VTSNSVCGKETNGSTFGSRCACTEGFKAASPNECVPSVGKAHRKNLNRVEDAANAFDVPNNGGYPFDLLRAQVERIELFEVISLVLLGVCLLSVISAIGFWYWRMRKSPAYSQVPTSAESGTSETESFR